MGVAGPAGWWGWGGAECGVEIRESPGAGGGGERGGNGGRGTTAEQVVVCGGDSAGVGGRGGGVVDFGVELVQALAGSGFVGLFELPPVCRSRGLGGFVGLGLTVLVFPVGWGLVVQA